MKEPTLLVVLLTALCVLKECTHLPLKDLVIPVKLLITVLEGYVKLVMLVPFPQVTLLRVPHVQVVHIVRIIPFTSVLLDSLV
jgi:hypothetical protein